MPAFVSTTVIGIANGVFVEMLIQVLRLVEAESI